MLRPCPYTTLGFTRKKFDPCAPLDVVFADSTVLEKGDGASLVDSVVEGAVDQWMMVAHRESSSPCACRPLNRGGASLVTSESSPEMRMV